METKSLQKMRNSEPSITADCQSNYSSWDSNKRGYTVDYDLLFDIVFFVLLKLLLL